jgi:hypothetical protein
LPKFKLASKARLTNESPAHCAGLIAAFFHRYLPAVTAPPTIGQKIGRKSEEANDTVG